METTNHRPAWKTLVAFAIIYFVWGSTFLAIRVGVREVPPLILAAMRFGVAGAILYGWMLARGERSRWHRIDAVEIWHYCAGHPLTLQIADGGDSRSVRLGPNLAAGEALQAIVPAQAWQAAETSGDWTLVGCTVAPGFDFATFELAPKGWDPASDS